MLTFTTLQVRGRNVEQSARECVCSRNFCKRTFAVASQLEMRVAQSCYRSGRIFTSVAYPDFSFLQRRTIQYNRAPGRASCDIQTARQSSDSYYCSCFVLPLTPRAYPKPAPMAGSLFRRSNSMTRWTKTKRGAIREGCIKTASGRILAALICMVST